MNDVISYALPAATDLEGNPITITAYEVGQTVLPTFISFTYPTFTISPTVFADVGVKTIEVKLKDGQPLERVYQFSLTVTNTAPHLQAAISNQSLYVF